jgi:hypothetical protein
MNMLEQTIIPKSIDEDKSHIKTQKITTVIHLRFYHILKSRYGDSCLN